MNRFSFLLVIITFLATNAYAQSVGNEQYHIKTVVLDPGHGGKDPGALYGKYYEKNITLKVAKLVGAKIKKEFPDVKVIYTRESDVFIPLKERTNIANKNNADLFISIHCNATEGSTACGTETFVMGLHRSKDNLEVSKRENASVLLEEDYEKLYDGYDPNNSEVSNIIFTLMQNQYLDNSLMLASFMEEQYVGKGYNSRGVRQQGFLVLYTATMPSVLTEIGFITNSSDRAKMISDAGQEKIAQSIFESFRKYKRLMEGLPDDSKEYAAANNNSSNKQPEKEEVVATETFYKIQFISTSEKLNLKERQYSKLKDISYTKVGKMYKYTTGKFKSKSDAQTYLKTVKKAGFKDAFIVCVDE